MTTGLEIITKAMQKIGALVKSEAPDSDEASDGLDALNDMLASWSTESILLYARTRETFTLVAGMASYTIGTSQTFNTTRPIFINDAYITNGTIDSKVTIITDENYDDITLKTTQGIPYWLNYNNSFPTGTIKLWPVPASAYSLTILSEKELTALTLAGTVSLPPGWKRALIYNLALELAPEYGQDAPASVAEIASKSKGAIATSIMRNRSMDWPNPSTGTFNVYAGM